MASMAASRAIDATLNHDLISLQVILQDIANNPRALLTTIHDVENNLLVQAGDTKALAHARSTKAYAAVIPIHDAVAGYVTVNMDTQLDSVGAVIYAFVGVSVILILVALLALQEMNGPLFLPPEPSLPAADSPAQAPPVDEPEPPVYIAHLHLRLVNLALLKQQLSGEILQQLFTRLEQSLVYLLKLYPGRCRTTSANGRAQGIYHLEFSSTEKAIAANFQAICCAHLAIVVNQQPKFKFLLQAVIGADEAAVVAAEYAQDQSAIYCLTPEGLDEEWDDLIFYNEQAGGLQCSGFVPPLDDEMLEKQESLARLLGRGL